MHRYNVLHFQPHSNLMRVVAESSTLKEAKQRLSELRKEAKQNKESTFFQIWTADDTRIVYERL